MGKEQRDVAGLELDEVSGVGPVGIGLLNAQLLLADGVEDFGGLATLRDGDRDPAFKGQG